MESTQVETEQLSVEKQCAANIEELVNMDRAYFGKDRVRILKAKIDDTVSLLDSKQIDMISNKKEKAELLFLRGKALSYLPEYTKQAEECLSKAIKLMPTMAKSWDALGHVYWKKNSLLESRKCFEGSLEQDENNMQTMRDLSMVIRQIQEPNEDQRKKNYQLSIQLANKCCALDMKDSQSWYVLGNAHLTNFFQNGQELSQLTSALKAYAQTERTMKEPNPDLFFNRATIYEYLERYSEAIVDYNAAHAIDQSLHADQKAGKIINYVVKTANLVLSRQDSKGQKTKDWVRTIPTSIEGTLKFPQIREQQRVEQQKYSVARIGDLSNGVNEGAILTCKVVMHLEKYAEVPCTCLIVDSQHSFAVASFYGTNKAAFTDKIQAGDLLYIKNPQQVWTALQFKGRQYSFQSVKVNDLCDVLVNDGQPLMDCATQNEAVSTQNLVTA